MIDLVLNGECIPETPQHIVEKIKAFECAVRPFENSLKVEMSHSLHAGVYARTAIIAPEMVITSVLIKIPTVLILSGEGFVLCGEEWVHFNGYRVIEACAGRKQIYVTVRQTSMTMLFATSAETVEEAENEMSDEAWMLLSRRSE